jgi:hypothetical protein
MHQNDEYLGKAGRNIHKNSKDEASAQRELSHRPFLQQLGSVK